MKGLYNNQGRKSGGYKKTIIQIGQAKLGLNFPSFPCKEYRHSDCDGYLTWMPHKEVNKCSCKCHE